MPVVALADHLTKVTYGACQDVSTASVNESDLDVQDIFEGVNLSAMAPHVVKGETTVLHASTDWPIGGSFILSHTHTYLVLCFLQPSKTFSI